MPTRKQIVDLLQPIADQHDDVVQIRRRLIIKPVGLLYRMVLIRSTSCHYYYNPVWIILPLMFPHDGSNYMMNDDIYGLRRGLWDIFEQDSADDLKKVADRQVIPFLRSLSSLDDYMALMRLRSSGWVGVHDSAFQWFCADLARGDFAAADAFLAGVEPYRHRLQEILPGYDYSAVVEPLAPLVAARDRAGIAAKLREFEAISVKSLGLEALWEYQPFPIEVQSEQGG